LTSTTRDPRIDPAIHRAARLERDLVKPASHKRSSSFRQFGCAKRLAAGHADMGVHRTSHRLEMASMSCHSPAWNAYSVSQYWQRSGQPVRRTNTVRNPTASASPCKRVKDLVDAQALAF
jgi:hypothetical protein